VDIYERAVKAFLALPLCKRGRGFPPSPTAVPGIAPLDQLSTARRGGRRPGRPIHERNALIAALKGQGLTARNICAELDARHVPVPRTWRLRSWSREYASDRSARGRIDKLVSHVSRQARIASKLGP
jgi:hypothetical protein